MDELLSAIERLAYPATRKDLIAALTEAGTEEESLARIESLPRERYDSADELSRDLVRRRAESNPSLVAITAEPCEECGFPRLPGRPHSCIEEKARFAESANSVSDEFELLDDKGEHDSGGST